MPRSPLSVVDDSDRTAEQFLAELFEFEYCDECGGDTPDHVAVLLDLGDYGANWSAICTRNGPEGAEHA